MEYGMSLNKVVFQSCINKETKDNGGMQIGLSVSGLDGKDRFFKLSEKDNE